MLALVGAAFAVGIALGEWLALPRAAALACALATLALLGVARLRDRLIGTAAVGLAAALGLVAVAAARAPLPPALIDGASYAVEAVIARAPERAFGTARVLCELVAVERAGQRRDASGRVMVLLGAPPVEPLLPGDPVRFVSALRAPRGLLNPGAPDAARRAAADGVVALASVHDPAGLAKLAVEPSDGIARRVAAWRARMLAEVSRRLDGERRALVASLVLGDRGDVDRGLDDAFRVAGVSHVLSVSGLHLAIAAFLFYWGLTKLLLRLPRFGRGRPVRRWAAAASLPATALYTLLTGAEVATVRACVVAAVWLGAVALDRRATVAGALAVAGLAVLAYSPLELFDPSFQLSFAAALGTALLGPRWSPSGSGGSLPVRVGRWALRLGAASAAAILATAPIGAWHFSQVAPAGLLSNLVVVPLAELGIVPVGLAGCALAVLHPPLGAPLLALAGMGAGAMAAFVRWFASWAPSWRVAIPTVLEIVAWYAGLLAVALARPRWQAIALGCGLVVSGSMAARAALVAASTTLRATHLDVGQGDACVVELPHGRVVVVDGGGSFDPAFDPGAQVIAPFLWRRGIRRIDLLILSHPHPDHANGLPFLVENFPVGEIWENGQPTALPSVVRLRQLARERHVPLGPPRPLTLAGVQVRPLAPLDDGGRVTTDPAASENDNSLVVELAYAGRRLLFAGDIEADAEARLVAGGLGVADVLKVPHHGSRTSSTAGLIAALHPTLAVISVGERNHWGFPNPGVLARYAEVGARVLRTDRNGAVWVSVSGRGGLEVATMR